MPTDRALPRPLRAPAAWSWPERRPTPASSGSWPSTTSWRNGYARQGVRHQPRGRRGARACRRSASLDELPDGEADLVFVCTPAGANPELLRQAAAKGIRAAFVASAGYGEAGEEGRRAQDELVALADELDLLVVGPQRPGRGVDARPRSAPRSWRPTRPPAASASPASRATSCRRFLNSPVQSGVGVSRAVSAGNAAQVGVARLPRVLRRRPRDRRWGWSTSRASPTAGPSTSASAAVTAPAAGGARQGRCLVTAEPRAAASHTGSLATDDRVFDGMCRQAGAIRAATGRGAFEAAASLRHPAAADGAEGGRRDDGGRVGRGHRRRHRPTTRSSCSPSQTTWPSSTSCSHPGGAATTPSTSPAARPRTPCPTSWRSSSPTPRSTPWSTSASASRRTRPGSSARARSTRTTASSGSSPSTSARTGGT